MSFPISNTTAMWVAKHGNDTATGGIEDPYLTITKAFSMVTSTRATMFVLPGEYAEAAILTWPSITGVKLVGLESEGNTIISNANAAAAVIDIDPTVQTANFEAFIENIQIQHDAQVGLQIDNTAVNKKLIVHLTNVGFEASSTGDSIDVAHTTAGKEIKLFANGCGQEVEGRVHITPAIAGEEFVFRGLTLIGGLTMANVAQAAELTLLQSVVLTGGLDTGNAATVVTNIGCVYRTDAGVYTQLSDAYSA